MAGKMPVKTSQDMSKRFNPPMRKGTMKGRKMATKWIDPDAMSDDMGKRFNP